MKRTQQQTPQREVKVRVWDKLTVGLDPENDPFELVADIEDNTSYAIDVAIFETAQAILTDIENADDSHNNAILAVLRKKWLVVPVDPEPPEIGTCSVSSLVAGLPEITLPDFIDETPVGKKAAEDANKIVSSIKRHQKKLKRRLTKKG